MAGVEKPYLVSLSLDVTVRVDATSDDDAEQKAHEEVTAALADVDDAIFIRTCNVDDGRTNG